MNSSSNCGTAAGPVKTKIATLYLVLSPEQEEIGTYTHYLAIAGDLMEIESIANEVHTQMRYERGFDWTNEDEQMWVRENTPAIAKKLGYQINRITR